MKRIITTITLAVAVLAGCTSSKQSSPTGSIPSTSPPATTESRSATASPPPCPNPEGANCLGPLAASRTYTTISFLPAISYSLPASGWFNYEDTPGNFLLVPPGNDLPGVNAGTSDFIGIYRAVAPSEFGQLPDCTTTLVPGIASTPRAMTTWLRQQSALNVSSPAPVTVGGLQGLVTDVRAKPGAKLPTCREGAIPITVFVLFSGVAQSHLDHGVTAGMTMRLYLLSYQGQVLAVELDDIDAAPGDLTSLSGVVRQLQFSA
jgi:hypothetical protein